MYMCMCVYIYIYMCVYIYRYTHMNIYKHRRRCFSGPETGKLKHIC